MTKKQINYRNMTEAVIQCLDNNAAAWSAITPIADEVALLKAQAEHINAVYKKQTEFDTVGYTRNKNLAFENMETQAYNIALKVKAYARKVKNMVLFEAVDFTMNDFSQGLQEQQLVNCQIIADKARSVVDLLGAYNVSVSDIDLLQTAIDTARPSIATRDVVQGERVEKTSTLYDDFIAMRRIFISLDEVIEALLPQEQELFEKVYFATRHVHGVPGSGKTRPVAPALPAA